MDLILWRHADAGTARDEPSDIERALTNKGEQQAERVAAWLDKHLPESAKVLVSPARRAQQTAKALKRSSCTDDRLAPEAGLDKLITASLFPMSKHAVVLVGHQPTLGLLASHFLFSTQSLALRAAGFSIAKGAVLWLHHREKNGAGETVLRALLSPAYV